MEGKGFEVRVNEQRLRGQLHLPMTGKGPLVIACHGLESSMSSPKYLKLAQRFTEENLAFARFDFRGCGQSEGRFEDTTLKRRVQDLDEVVAFLVHQKGFLGPLGLLGSSFGGCVALLEAWREKRVGAVVALATPFFLEERLKDPLWQGTDLSHWHEALDTFSRPLLIIHGSEDEVVPISHAHGLHEKVKGSTLRVMDGADHVFSNPHHLEEVVELSLRWFKEHLP